MGWTPILEGRDATPARDRIHAIADRLRGLSFEGALAADLALGGAGLAIFFAYLGEEEAALSFLERAIEGADRHALGIGLFHGLTGVAWTLEHLRALLDGDPNAATDEALAASLGTDEFDLVSGLAGIGVYALERQDRALVEGVVARLASIARPIGDGIAWFTPPDRRSPEARDPNGRFDPGMAHGTAGVIAFLARAGARELAGRAVSFVQRSSRARSSWCNGDPGISAGLFPLTRELYARADAPQDASLCHGAAGLAHIAARMASATGDPQLRDEARRWYRTALAMPVPEEPGLLIGAAGVGLALLAATAEDEPAWDRLLLLDL